MFESMERSIALQIIDDLKIFLMYGTIRPKKIRHPSIPAPHTSKTHITRQPFLVLLLSSTSYPSTQYL